MQANRKQQQISDYAAVLIRCKARQLVGKAGFTWDDVEDLEQEMRLDLLERLAKFDPDKAKRTTFVARVVERKISKLFRDRAREKRDYRRECGSLNDSIQDGEGETVERAYTMDQDAADICMGRRDRTREDEAMLSFDVALVLSALPQNLRLIAEELMEKTITEAAKSLGRPRSTR
jgi:RNA polymerase sigma-70 factor (ECF subfamily)